MKKIFTLVFAVGMFTMAQAQYGPRDTRQPDQRNQQTDQRNPQIDQRYQQPNQWDNKNGYDNGKDWGYNNNSRYDDRFSMERKRDMEIARINREYDWKIQRVRNSFFLFRYEKERQIRMLQEQRQQEIRMVYMKFSGRRGWGHDNDRDNRDGRYDERNNHY